MCPIHIEFIPDGGLDDQIILLYGKDPQAAARLREQVAALAAKRAKRVAIHEIPGFEPVADCRLFFSVGRSDVGTYSLRARNEFECELDPVGWENVFGLLESIAEETNSGGYHYLDRSYRGITVIFSESGDW